MTRARQAQPSLLALAGLVAAGGAVGTTLRALLERAWPAEPGGWPWTTSAINLVGSFALGALLETLARQGPDEGRRRLVRLGAGTGVLGGFTTYSTFVVEVERRLSGGVVATGLAYALVSVVLGLVAAWLGVAAAGALRRTTSTGARP
ncbi:fluoride efflux transporter FluC [Cellulomonas massiliensis]|uniref:fluoride efflux transporter FluC n=1 Tax=Cellulomonas massiliensis TaxID=1465811 RepID=UPI00058AFFCE|nr:CrcB family protein [Cellulomonas massiliensis]